MKKKVSVGVKYSIEKYKTLPENFRIQFEKNVVSKIQEDLSLLASNVKLNINLSELEENPETGYIIGSKFVNVDDFSAANLGLISHIKIYWKGENSIDNVYGDHHYRGDIFFEIENYPSKEEIGDIVSNYNDFIEKINQASQKNALRRLYRFKISIAIILIDKEIKMKIKTNEKEEIINATLLKLNREYNEKYPDAINYLTLTEQPKGWYEAYIDLGYGGSDAIDYILGAFNDSDLEIEKITVS